MLNLRRVALAALAVLFACRSREAYPPEVADQFLVSCMAKLPAGQERQRDAFAASCRCMLDRIQEQYSLEQFNALEARMSAANTVPDDLLQIAAQCRAKGG